MEKQRIGILGGTFDPPHLGHLVIANEVLHTLKLDQIAFMPNQEPPHKARKSGTTESDRLQMLELAIKDNPNFAIEKIELERQGKSFSLDTMKLLKDRNPGVEYYFIIGADMVEYLANWHGIDELINIVSFIGVNRPKYELESPYPVQYIEIPQMDISSTLIRERCKKSISIKYLLPDNVIRYIEENGLYES
ncbi:nicotinate-nucleotide adenylyltransferase [Lederbergia galactosidilytica]|uniref:Probable nicotinate-nucleotide adenylyltransferase n=1 Tax=Lederbergia galactosidilytica TaxID=217031 RepID=A0A0Q9Y7B9_9BACI|nr:nicotinate-nucleotide adenylyltransferase [Lederbergia galactosidilytica]KRG15520.1 nicotinate-nucleotide adenylyltransferase [Virgibacillus soli]KRG16779.1 nicotinate-nucleotide adenylyltransferase [Lederbergia galactosidilytica]MBP1914850.1 nicotinate-nucleotide adenylyltransferase [Lederbergia galactosidilytica]OAK74420.1 nicotinate-nucleotide adenylyltransferase [Lederbergia galactosidilytica]